MPEATAEDFLRRNEAIVIAVVVLARNKKFLQSFFYNGKRIKKYTYVLRLAFRIVMVASVHIGLQINAYTDRQTDRHTDTQADTQTDTLTDTQTDSNKNK